MYVYLALFANDIYGTGHKGAARIRLNGVARPLQHKTPIKIQSSISPIHVDWQEIHLMLNGRNIPPVIHVKHLGASSGREIKQRPHRMMEAKAFKTFLTAYSLFKSKRLSANIKLTAHKAFTRQCTVTYAFPCLESDISFEIAAPKKQGSAHYWLFSTTHTGSSSVSKCRGSHY
jgi:hypothetical protein